MSDSEDYEYEYDDSDKEAMDDGGGDGADGGNDDDQSFDYTDDDENPNGGDGDGDDGEIALENAYYNAKAERDAGDVDEARHTFERVIGMEVDQNKKAAGIIAGVNEDCADYLEQDAGEEVGGGSGNTAMDVEGVSSDTKRLTSLKYHGLWSYKAIKQLVKLHLRSLDGKAVLKDYTRMLRVASTPDAAISPNAMEKGVTGMLDRVSNVLSQSTSAASTASTTTSDPRFFARGVYDLTLEAFHPTAGISPNERLWFKTNLKYGQLLYEMNETAKLQLIIRDLLISSGQPTDILGGGVSSSSATAATESTTTSSGGTHLMEIAALQIQLYSRLKDTKKLRAAYHRAMTVRGGIPHPRTLALIQELGGKMQMSQRNFHEASQSFFQAFKSYDEAGDRSRLRCLKYLVMASMLHASSINPFDSHEARAHRDDPEIVAMTNLVQAFHNDDIRKFEYILKKNEGHIMDDEFVREHVSELLRTIRTQVIMRTIGPYTRIRLERIAKDLNDIPVEDVESLLVSLILDGKLAGGLIDQVNGLLVKKAWTQGTDGGGEKTKGSTAVDTSAVGGSANSSPEAKYQASLMWLTSSLEHLSCVVSKV